MTIEEIIKLAADAAKIKREAQPALYVTVKRKEDKKRDKTPEYYKGYADRVYDYSRIKVHSEPGYFPSELFEKRSPNQTQKELDYIEQTYEQNTISVFIDFVNTVSRIFHDSNWSIKYNTDKDSYINAGLTLQQYLETQIEGYGSLETFIKEMLPTVKLRDAEGVITVRPRKVDVVETEDGEVIQDESKLLRPQPFYFRCDQVVGFETDQYYLIESDDKSMVDYGGRKAKTGLVYEFYDRNAIYIIRQTGKYSDYLFDIEPLYVHNLNELFVYKLRGIPVYKCGELLWQSPFLYACSALNSALLDEANLRISKNMCVYPYRVQLGNLCEFDYIDKNGNHSTCMDGQVYDSFIGGNIVCPDCNGLGTKSRISPMGVMLLKPKTNTDDGDSTFTGDPMKYVSPEVHTLELLRTEIEGAMLKARNVLHLNNSNTEVKGSTDMTATGQFMDMKAMYAFIKPISDQLFNLYESIVNAIGLQRYGADYAGIELAYPVTFDFQTTSDYIAEITALLAAGAPPFMVQAVMMKFLRALFYNEKTAAKAFDLLVHSDRLISINQTDIAYGLSKGTVALYEAILHDSGISFVNDLFLENDKFFEQDFIVQKQQLIERVKAKASEVAPASNTDNVIDLLNA